MRFGLDIVVDVMLLSHRQNTNSHGRASWVWRYGSTHEPSMRASRVYKVMSTLMLLSRGRQLAVHDSQPFLRILSHLVGAFVPTSAVLSQELNRNGANGFM